MELQKIVKVEDIPVSKMKNGKIKYKVSKNKSVKLSSSVAVDLKKPVKKFDGLSLEQVMSKFLSDRIVENLYILIIGINPSPLAAHRGHHYVGNNHMWPCLFKSGLIDQPLKAEDDVTLPEKYKIGFTTMVERTTPRQCDLAAVEFEEGGQRLLKKIESFAPKIAVFNGRKIYEIFLKKVLKQKKVKFDFGRQLMTVSNAKIFVMPSTSAACATYPSFTNKVPFFADLKKWRDELVQS